MARMNELSQVLDELVSCGEGMIRAATALREIFSEDAPTEELEQTPTTSVKPAQAKTYSFTDVRKAFSAKAHAGYTDQIKTLIAKYGADKLSGVKEADYQALMADLEDIG